MIVTNDYKFSSNVNEVIGAVLNFFFFFLQKDLILTKSTKLLNSEQKLKMRIKNI